MLVAKFTLPDYFDAEAECAQSGFFASISRSIASYLFLPPLVICTWKTRKGARRVSVPETSVDEDAPAVRLVDNVGTSRKVARAYTKTSAELVQEGANRFLQLRVTLPNGPHASRSFWSGLRARGCCRWIRS